VNTAGIVAMAKAGELIMKDWEKEAERMARFKKRFTEGVLEKVSGVKINGGIGETVSNMVNLSFARVEGEAILMSLDYMGVMVSTGSACSADDLKPSYVLLAMGKSVVEAHGSIRFSWGRWTTEEEIDYAIEMVAKVIKKLRCLSPIKNA